VNALGFIAALVQSLAWPLVVLVVAIVFRGELKTLMFERMKRFKAGPLEVEWERQLLRVEAQVEPAPPELAAAGGSLVAELGGVAHSQPGWAVIQAYERVVQRLRPYLVGNGAEPERPLSGIVAKLRTAEKAGTITPEVARAVEGMTILRNLAAHRPSEKENVTPDRAREYLAMADGVIFALGPPPAN